MITFLAGLLAFGTLWFWLFSLAVFIGLTLLVENDEGVWATIVFVGTVLSLNFLSKIPLLDYVKNNPGHTLMYVGLYFAIGVVWTIIKWYFFVHRKIVAYTEFKRKFLKDRGVEALTPALANELIDRCKAYSVSPTPPDPADHKGDLTRWGTYWIFSMVGTALNDVVRRAWEYVYEMLQTTYDRMAKAIFKSASADVELAKSFKAAAGSDGDTAPRSRR
jgi:hypothetical protein